jgi:hypothetical protein
MGRLFGFLTSRSKTKMAKSLGSGETAVTTATTVQPTVATTRIPAAGVGAGGASASPSIGDAGMARVPDVDVSEFPAFQADSDLAEAIAANTGGSGFDLRALVRVKTPAGGGKIWTYPDGGNNEVEARAIEGVLVYVGRRGTLWGSVETTKGRPPVLVSYDLKTAEQVNDDIGDLDREALEACRVGDGIYDWQRLPWNKDGTGKGGHGRRCKESRLLGILQAGQAFPVLVSAGPGSLKTVCPFLTRLEVPHWRVRVSLTLDRAVSQGGVDYSQIVPRVTGKLSRDAGLAIKRLYTDPLIAVERQIEIDGE